MSEIIVVFGATGKQGGSVIQAIQNDQSLAARFKIRAVTRNLSSSAAQKLVDKGLEVIQGDMSVYESVEKVVSGADTVFLVTNFWEQCERSIEVSQGKNVTDACKVAGVQHLIFSSLIDASEESKGAWVNIPHFDGKAEIERYIRQSGVPASFILAGTYMTEIEGMLQRHDGNYVIALPLNSNAEIPLLDASEDTGLFVKAAIKNHKSVLGQRIYASAAYYTIEQIIEDFSKVTGKAATFMKVTEEQFKSFLPPNKAVEVFETLMMTQTTGYYAGADLTDSLKLLDGKPTEWKGYVAKNREKWL
ncbi:hypothetical protein BGW36DRAFT_390557 [Talaromyces proteolyticus]|uniref:NmrA-like domain-containing protein n=1 Tax=Talaromyces proteolyticus TaxID=1131652 RepID=A0AAD4PVH5_9EURO|nr:uncharacterized protein BGW36DRAFT_390557 [Talaromyces proteolyticus]KAH8690298.1 hypothetical protein BGW36DRAFT_390557 [Talaromyces proteolyticus]